MSPGRPRHGSRQAGDPVFAGIIAAFASAVDRLRWRRRNLPQVGFTQESILWDDDPDGGLAASRVPRRPPDLSGSGSEALVEPGDSNHIRGR